METFQMLPLAAGKTFAINFYDAGLGKPDYIIYKVIGSEVMMTMDNQKVDCWKLLMKTITKASTSPKHFGSVKKATSL